MQDGSTRPTGGYGNRPPPGAPAPGEPEHTLRLGEPAHTALFPTVFGADVPMSTVGDPLVGQLLDGRYQITQRLARGGMATVYQAVDTRLTRTVAVKIMHVGLGDDADFARKFDREARAAAKLSHPNVVSVFDQGQGRLDGGISRPYIVMEYVDGSTLRDLINRDAPLTPLRALQLIEPVLSALAAAHDAGLVHRDVKPENVLIGDRGQLKVADFGLAKAISSQTQTATQGLLIGTVSYLPPELVVSGRSDARSDVYSTGIVLFELLTGIKPHTGDTPIQVAYAHVHKDVPRPSTFPTAGPIPPYLDALVTRATSRNADHRPHDARVLLTQVRRVRSALEQGLADDVELTQDLSGYAGPIAIEVGADDRADYEATQLVPDPRRPVPPTRMITTPTSALSAPTVSYAPPPGPASAFSGPTTPTSAYSPPTVFEAPPPPVPRTSSVVAPERVAALRARQVRKRRRGLAALLIVLLLTTLAALAGWYLTEGRFTSTPALAALPRAEAEQVASKSEVRLQFSDRYSESVARGEVIETDPGPGSKVRKGSTVEAALSLGPERYPMPTVVGLTQSAAETAVQQSKLRVGAVTEKYSETIVAGIVLGGSHKAGASLKPNTAISLEVSRGPRPIKIVNYRGKDADAAKTALTKAGFQVVEAKAVNSDKYARGEVLTQDPSSGRAAKGTTITLTRSLGPVMVTVPTVSRMGIKAAKETLEAAGFKTRTRQASIYLGLGYVHRTDPPALSQAPKGSVITIFVV